MEDPEVAEAFAHALGRTSLLEFPIIALDRIEVPVWSVWWNGPEGASGGIGYGPTEDRARVGALGECVEHVLALRSLPTAPYETGSLSQLRDRRGADAAVDPRTLGLPAGVPFDDDRPLHWWPLRRLRDGATVWAPVELVASSGAELPREHPGAGWLVTPVSNGLGAGTSVDQAVSHALLEILQRDGNGLSIRALDAGRVLDLQGVRDPVTLDALDRLRTAGVHVEAKIAATDFGLANIDVVGMAEDDDILSATACGEAVHPDREVALRKAVLEFASARARKQLMHGPLAPVLAIAPPAYAAVAAAVDPAAEEQRVLHAMVEWLRLPRSEWEPMLRGGVLRVSETVPFTDLPTSKIPSDALLGDVARRLEGFDVLVRDFGDPERDGPVAVKVLVPGMEVETVAYGRIGERNAARLLAMGRDDLVRVGTRPDPGWDQVHLTSDGRERLGGDVWVDRARLDAVAGSMLPLYREPGRHTAQQVLHHPTP